MKLMRSFLCIALVLFMSLFLSDLPGLFPINNSALVSEKYNGWSGVLRVWYCGGWAEDLPGISGWLNRCAGKFEKSHEGVYIQIQTVGTTAAIDICENGVIPPDVILFPPGIFDAPRHLIPLEDNTPVRTNLSSSGVYNGITYALPIIIGGYAWAFNTDLLDSIPDTWEDTNAAVACLPDDAHNNWGAAVAALCSGSYLPGKEDSPHEHISFDVDLGLSIIEETPEPSQTPSQSSDSLLYCKIPATFSIYKDAWTDFLSKKIAAVPVSSSHIRLIKNLSEQGKCPAWDIAASGDVVFSDQLLFAGIIDRAFEPSKIDLCKSLIQYLLSGESQQTLSSTGAFSVTDTLSGYPGHDPAAVVENALHSRNLCIVPAFKNSFNEDFDLIVRDFHRNKGFTPELYRRILDLCS